MQIDQASYKRTTQRVSLLEELVELQAENIAALIRCCKALAARLPRAAGSADPFDLVMMDRNHKPYILPRGLAEELDNAVHKWAIAQLPQEEEEEYHRRTRLIWKMLEMRSERELRMERGNAIGKTSGGGTPGATHFNR